MFKRTIISVSAVMALTVGDLSANEQATLTDIKESLYYLIENYNNIDSGVKNNKADIYKQNKKIEDKVEELTFLMKNVSNRVSILEKNKTSLPSELEIVDPKEDLYDKQIKAYIQKQQKINGETK